MATIVPINGLGTQEQAEISQASASGMQLSGSINKGKGIAFEFENQGGFIMSDFDGAKGIKTYRDDDLAGKIVDGQSGSIATKKLTIEQHGTARSAGVNDFGIPQLVRDATDNLVIPQQGAAGGTQVEVVNEVDIRDLTHVSDSVKVGDGTDFLAITTAGEANTRISAAQAVDGATAPAEAVMIGGKDPSGNIQQLSTDTAGNLKVVVAPDSTVVDVLDYKTTASLAKNAVATHDYVVPTGKTFTGAIALVGASTELKVRIGTYDGTTFTPKFCYFQNARENIDHNIAKLSLLGDGTNAIRIEITNKDAASDVYSSLEGSHK
jgi:hypothetical protein